MTNILHINFRRKYTYSKAIPAVDRGMRIPTAELKLHIRVLEVVLAIPSEHEHAVKSERVYALMDQRLTQYRRELALRDALRDQGQPLTDRSTSLGVSALPHTHERAA